MSDKSSPTKAEVIVDSRAPAEKPKTYDEYLEVVRKRVATECTSVLAPRLGDDPCSVIAEFVSIKKTIPSAQSVREVGGFLIEFVHLRRMSGGL